MGVRSGIALLLVGVLPALGGIARCEAVRQRPLEGPGCEATERRFAKLVALLGPIDHIGYRTDVDSHELLGHPLAAARYFCAQYALAPIALRFGSDEPLVIGDFAIHGPALFARIEGFEMRTDYGNGLLLLEPKPR